MRLAGALVMPRVANKMKLKHQIQKPESEFQAALAHWVDKGLENKAFYGGEQPSLVDTSVFGVEPAVAGDRFVTPVTTEWFAFFYFGYFFGMGAHIFPFLFLGKDDLLMRHFALGIFFQFCATHLLYMVVPGFGPYKALTFVHALDGGTFRDLVMSSVHSAGAQKDIFPSLHTGAPTFLTVFSFLHRDRKPFKYTWPILAFVVSQIIIATMFLRWHWLVDIVAGFSLATANALVSRAIVRWEARRREARGSMPIFGPSVRG